LDAVQPGKRLAKTNATRLLDRFTACDENYIIKKRIDIIRRAMQGEHHQSYRDFDNGRNNITRKESQYDADNNFRVKVTESSANEGPVSKPPKYDGHLLSLLDSDDFMVDWDEAKSSSADETDGASSEYSKIIESETIKKKMKRLLDRLSFCLSLEITPPSLPDALDHSRTKVTIQAPDPSKSTIMFVNSSTNPKQLFYVYASKHRLDSAIGPYVFEEIRGEGKGAPGREIVGKLLTDQNLTLELENAKSYIDKVNVLEHLESVLRLLDCPVMR
jgi:hypothetical protein